MVFKNIYEFLNSVKSEKREWIEKKKPWDAGKLIIEYSFLFEKKRFSIRKDKDGFCVQEPYSFVFRIWEKGEDFFAKNMPHHFRKIKIEKLLNSKK